MTEPADYGTETHFVCSSLKSARGFWTMRLDEYWGYRMYPGMDKNIDDIRERYGQTPVRLELEAVERWLDVYRGMADVRVDYKSNKGAMAKEGDEPWFSTGMGAIVIAAASGMFDKIVLAGFDAMTSGDRTQNKGVLRLAGYKYPPHAFNVERDMLPLIQHEHGVAICPI